MVINRMAMPTIPNSCPLNGSTPKTVVAEPNPMSEVNTTEPHEAQPTPNKLVATPTKDTPISCCIFIDWRK